MVFVIGVSRGTGESPRTVRDSKRRGSRQRATLWEGAVPARLPSRSATRCSRHGPTPRALLPVAVRRPSMGALSRCIPRLRDSSSSPWSYRKGSGCADRVELWSDRCRRDASCVGTWRALRELRCRTWMPTVPSPCTVSSRSLSKEGSGERSAGLERHGQS